jgi:hypothetical protein
MPPKHHLGGEFSFARALLKAEFWKMVRSLFIYTLFLRPDYLVFKLQHITAVAD